MNSHTSPTPNSASPLRWHLLPISGHRPCSTLRSLLSAQDVGGEKKKRKERKAEIKTTKL